jgi:bacterial/archaeal transporter family protein
MSSWLIPALLAPFLDTLSNFTDQYIVSKQIKDYRSMPVLTGIIGLCAGIIFYIATGFPILSLRDSLLIMASGLFTVVGLYFYFAALMQEEMSRVIIYFKIIPVMVLVLSFVLLHDTITMRQLAGFILVLLAIAGVSYKPNTKGFGIPHSLMLILLTDLFWSIAAILAKYTIGINTLPKILSYESFGIGFGGIALYFFIPSIRRGFIQSVRLVTKPGLAALIGNEVLFVISKSITFFAYSLGPAALVSVLGGVQVFYGIAVGVILTYLFPAIFHEGLQKNTIVKKAAFSLVLFAGIFLVY